MTEIEKQNHLSKRINEIVFHLQDANTDFEEALKLIKKIVDSELDKIEMKRQEEIIERSIRQST